MSSKGVKRSGSLGSGASESEAKKKYQTPVEIADDAWLETLRSLSFRQWSKVRIVSRQLNGVAQRNVSTLPCAIIDSATTRLMQRNNISSNIIVLDSTIPATDAIQWYKDRDIVLDIPKDIQLNYVFTGINLEENFCVDITVLGSVQHKKLSLQDQASHQASKKEVVFYAEFRPKRNENSWASMVHFLKLLYHPVTYVKELSMYSLDTKLKDTLFAGEDRYIRCGLFTFQIPTGNRDDNFRESLSWLEKNVRAETIDFSNDNKKINLEKISNFFFEATWKCAKREIKLGELYYVELRSFLDVLVEKFRAVVSLPRTFPAIVFSGYHELDDGNSMKAPVSGTDVIEESSDESGGGIVYVVSNGQNRMRVECSRKDPNDNQLRHVIAWGPGGRRGYNLRQYNIRVEVYAV